VIAPVGVDLAEAFRGLADPPLGELRYRVYYGGRGGAKSWSFARALLIHGTERRHRILCTREYQNSIRDSVHKLLRDQVYQLGLDGFYSVEQARIYGANGTEFLFYGLKRDPHTIKGLEGVTLAWIEEAHTTSKESWEILDPTIREEGSEIWASFNPDQPTDPLYKIFAIGEPPARSLVRKVGWQDNPWLPEVLRHQRDEMYRRDPEAEAHVWGGNPWSKSDDQILRGRYRVEDFEPDDSWGDPLFGADWGFSQDPTVLVKLWLRDSRLWIEYDERGVGWSMAEIDRRFRRVPGASDYVIRGDCSRPETINELRQLGLRVQPAAKWTGSVEDGAEHLRSYEEIVIHPRCSGIIQEARLWRYKRDPRTDDVLPKIRDGNDHGWDAARYALEPIIRRRPSLRVLAHSPW
jgi:phage terminase large subunit